MIGAEKYYLSSDICVPLLSIAADLGFADEDVLCGTGLSVNEIRDPAQLLSTEAYFRLLKNVITRADINILGLTAGLLASFNTLGILGLAMLSAASFKEAVKLGASYAAVSGAIGQTSYIEQNNNLAFQIEPLSGPPALIRYLIDEQFASLYNYQATILGSEYSLTNGSKVIASEIHFAYPAPDDLSRYRDLFRCKLEFGADHNRMWISQDTLESPLPLTNETAFTLCREQCEKLLSDRKELDHLARRVQTYLFQNPRSFPSITETAEVLEISPRSLRRQLKESGSTYSALISNVKCQWAEELLANPALSIEEIGELLGYSEATNFRRAFRSWTNLSPSQFRRS